MTLKPPSKTFPKLVMKEWPSSEGDVLASLAADIERHPEMMQPISEDIVKRISDLVKDVEVDDKSLSDFTRVLEGVEGQKRPQKEKSRDE